MRRHLLKIKLGCRNQPIKQLVKKIRHGNVVSKMKLGIAQIARANQLQIHRRMKQIFCQQTELFQRQPNLSSAHRNVWIRRRRHRNRRIYDNSNKQTSKKKKNLLLSHCCCDILEQILNLSSQIHLFQSLKSSPPCSSPRTREKTLKCNLQSLFQQKKKKKKQPLLLKNLTTNIRIGKHAQSQIPLF